MRVGGMRELEKEKEDSRMHNFINYLRILCECNAPSSENTTI